MKLRSQLALLILGAMAPLVIVGVIASVVLVSHERDSVSREAVGRARAAMTAIDAELRGTIATLRAVAASPSLHAGDVAAFHEEAQRVLASQPDWLDLGLIARDRTQLVAAILPLGPPIPHGGDVEAVDEVVRTGEPAIGNVAYGPVTRIHTVRVRVPVILEGEVRYVLAVPLKLESIERVLRQQQLPPDWVIVVADRNGRFIARLPPRPAGDPISPSFRAALERAPEGFFRGRTVEGFETYTPYVTSALSGWALGIAVPAAVIDAGAKRLAIVLIGGLLLALVIGWALAGVMSRRISVPIAALADAAASFTGKASGIDEIDQVQRRLGDALREARERATALEREAAALREAEQALTAANRAKDQFLAMLGHELRNPLGAIVAATSVLNRPGANEQNAASARAVIGRQVRHLTRMVDDLLDVSRVTSGKITLVRAPLDLGALALQTIRTLRDAGRFDDHRVEVHAAPVWIDGDETRIEQVLANLVGNAVKYTPPSGRIDVRVRAEGDAAVVEVADTGSGMPPELLDRVFDLFAQGEHTIDRSRGGLGIGLTLVKALVEMHGGSVVARSDGEGKGALFTVRLPRVAAPQARAGERSPAVAAATESGGRRVLVVEDNADAREMLCAHLRAHGHEVAEASDGPSAIAIATVFGPDAALVDIGLPGCDGYEVARRLRGQPAGDARLLVAVTGYGQSEDRDRAHAAGFDAHMSKPVDFEQLEAILTARRRLPLRT